MRSFLRENQVFFRGRSLKNLLTVMVLLAVGCCPANASTLATFRVVHVIDGDTIVLENGRHVRYIGIDAPEIFHKKKTAQPFGVAARAYNRKLIQGTRVTLEFDVERKDAYQRWLAYVYDKEKKLLNRLMLQRGYAYCLVIYPNTQHLNLLLQAQRAAMDKGLGIWKYWGDRKERVVGNSRTMRFHLATCPYGRRILKQNRMRFNSIREAFWEGYAPCKRCLPVSPLAR